MTENPLNILIAGATGYIGSTLTQRLLDHGHHVTCIIRPKTKDSNLPKSFKRVEILNLDLTDDSLLKSTAFENQSYDVVISCLASRHGAPEDAWKVDYQANHHLLKIAQRTNNPRFLLLSAICVQKPKLAFQFAKLKFEQELRDSGLTYTIIRPTAFFKSLSGQIESVLKGKAFYVFGDGQLTTCLPISTNDLCNYMLNALISDDTKNKILNIGGPGPAVTPLDQAELLKKYTGKTVKIRKIPISIVNAILYCLSGAERIFPFMAKHAEFARIAKYYATESMLLIDPNTGDYSVESTPKYGQDTLEEHYRRIISGESTLDNLGEHALFK